MNGPLCWYLRRRVPLTLSSCSVSVPQCPKMKVTYFLVESELFRQRYIIYACRRRGIISIISVLQYAHWLRSVLLVLVVSWTKTPLPSQCKQSINYSLMQYVHPRSSWDSHRSSHCRIIRPFEFLPTHRALSLRRILLDPLHNAMHMKVVSAFAREQAAIISRVFARRTCTIEMHLADTADVVVGNVPSPGRYCIPLLDLDFHLEICNCMNI